MKVIIIVIIALALGYFIGVNSIYTETYGYPPLGKPFIQQDDGSFTQSIERMETKTHIGMPFGKNRNRSYFMMFDAWPNGLPEGKYYFPGGTYEIGHTILGEQKGD